MATATTSYVLVSMNRYNQPGAYMVDQNYVHRTASDSQFLGSIGKVISFEKERKVTNMAELFSRSLDLTVQIQNQFNIIQNENVENFDSELTRFEQRIHLLVQDLQKLKHDVVNHIKINKIK